MASGRPTSALTRRRLPMPARRWSAILAILTVAAGCSSTIAGQAVPAAGQRTTVSAPSSSGDRDPTTPPSSSGDREATPPPSSPRTTPPSGPGRSTPATGGPDAATTGPPQADLPTPPKQIDGSSDAPGGDGAAGIGDPYYPTSGNGGYQVEHYDISLSYRPETGSLTAVTTITAKVTAGQALRRFNLDLQPTMKVAQVRIAGASGATFSHKAGELTVVPATPLAVGQDFSATISYAGKPGPIGGGTAGLGDGGWFATKTGGALVAGEPASASAWYPVNEHPSDPATYSIQVQVPKKWKVMSGGVKAAPTTQPAAGMAITRWVQDVPIASYLTTLYIDTFTELTDTGPRGLPIVSALAPGDSKDRSLHEMTGKAVEVLESYFGPYPFAAAGGIFSDEDIPFALETATRPVYASWVDPSTVVHELAHQWYGDSVMVHRWSDVCLNECFASYAPWLYDEATSDVDLDDRWRGEMRTAGADDSLWAIPLVDMGAGNEFTTVYTRGPLALHVLRKVMGEEPFRALLKQWPATYKGRSATMKDLQEAAERLSGKDLGNVFDVWFRATTAPTVADYPAALR